jgi:hypothetical protein
MFSPFGVGAPSTSSTAADPEPVANSHPQANSHAEPAPPVSDSRNDIEEMKRQLGELQKRIEGIAPKE